MSDCCLPRDPCESTVPREMPFLRCSCGAVHAYSSLTPIGRQQGSRGEFGVLTNCPECGSTFCMGLETSDVASVMTERRSPARQQDQVR